MTLAGVSVNTNLPLLPLTAFGTVGAETAALFLAVVAMCFVVRMAWDRSGSATSSPLSPVVANVLLSDQRAVLVNLGLVVLVVVVGIVVGPGRDRSRPFTWGRVRWS